MPRTFNNTNRLIFHWSSLTFYIWLGQWLLTQWLWHYLTAHHADDIPSTRFPNRIILLISYSLYFFFTKLMQFVHLLDPHVDFLFPFAFLNYLGRLVQAASCSRILLAQSCVMKCLVQWLLQILKLALKNSLLLRLWFDLLRFVAWDSR